MIHGKYVCGKDSHGEPNFFTTSSCDQNYILPLNNVTKRLIGLTKSYEQLIENKIISIL